MAQSLPRGPVRLHNATDELDDPLKITFYLVMFKLELNLLRSNVAATRCLFTI